MSTEPEPSIWTILSVLRWTTSYFVSRGIDSPRTTAELLLTRALYLDKIDLYLRFDQPLQPAELSTFRALIKRRIAGEPTAYILGTKSFWNQDLIVTPDVLIPRPETEHLVEAARRYLQSTGDGRDRAVLDLGTGTGAVVLALAAEVSRHRFFATDRSLRALAIARTNARRNHIDADVHFICGHWFQALGSDRPIFDLVVSNPPYIPSGEIENLPPEIRQHEPRNALDGGPDGLSAVREILSQAPFHLRAGGSLMLEIGAGQHRTVQSIIRQVGKYGCPEFVKDYSGHKRVLQVTVADAPGHGCGFNAN